MKKSEIFKNKNELATRMPRILQKITGTLRFLRKKMERLANKVAELQKKIKRSLGNIVSLRLLYF